MKTLPVGGCCTTARGRPPFLCGWEARLFSAAWRTFRRVGRHGPFTLYDPCCGGAYLLTTIALLHGKEFALLMASDIDGEMLELARDNLSLPNPFGDGGDVLLRSMTICASVWQGFSPRSIGKC